MVCKNKFFSISLLARTNDEHLKVGSVSLRQPSYSNIFSYYLLFANVNCINHLALSCYVIFNENVITNLPLWAIHLWIYNLMQTHLKNPASIVKHFSGPRASWKQLATNKTKFILYAINEHWGRGGGRLWLSRSNLTWKSIFTSFCI